MPIMRGPLRMLVVATALAALSGCGGQSSAMPSALDASTHRVHRALTVTPLHRPSAKWQPVAMVEGQAAVWEARRSGVTLLRFDQQLVSLVLHAGLGEPRGTWTHGDRVGSSETAHVIAAFNGGFKFSTGVVGYMSEGRTAVPLRPGRGSIVTYRDGTTQIGSWRADVPARGQPIASVLQNLHLLVDHGKAAPTVGSCIESCWGGTVAGTPATARSALGIDGAGQLVWAAGENLSPAGIATTLTDVGVQRAVELDINPDWVAAYLYVHGGGQPKPAPVVSGQHGIAGRFLAPYSRDFFTILSR